MQGTKEPYKHSGKTNISWLATVVVLFTALYFQLSFAGFEALLSYKVFAFFTVGAALAAILLDLPAFILRSYITARVLKNASDETTEHLENGAGALGTFIKAGQVIIAFVATKYGYSWYFLN